MGRQVIFLLTFLTYATVHMMRTTYSFNKHTLQQIFGIGDLFLGFLDSFIYLTLAFGTFMRYSILNSHKPVQACLFTAFPTVLGFSIIPIISLCTEPSSISEEAGFFTYFFLIICFGCFGFFQLSFFPATITIFSHHFDVKNDGRLVGIWSSKSNAGNIIGFFLANFMVYQLHIRWQITMLLCSGILLLVCILLYLLVPNPDFQDKEQITTSQFFTFFKGVWSQPEFRLYILSFSLFKAVLYSYELWTPKFLADTGYKNFSGYVPMLFDISTLFGSFVMGDIYKKQSNQENVGENGNYYLRKYKFFIPSVIVVVICLLYTFVPGSLAVYFILGALMGLFLGAIYNSLENNEIMNYTKNDPAKTDMISTINIGIGCSLVGISQFIIGFVLNVGEKHQHREDIKLVKSGNIYIIICIIAVIASIFTFLRTTYQKCEPIHEKDNEFQLIQTNPKDPLIQ